eukprot:jgi/Mesvir1/13992/Mv22529-RA.1
MAKSHPFYNEFYNRGESYSLEPGAGGAGEGLTEGQQGGNKGGSYSGAAPPPLRDGGGDKREDGSSAINRLLRLPMVPWWCWVPCIAAQVLAHSAALAPAVYLLILLLHADALPHLALAAVLPWLFMMLFLRLWDGAWTLNAYYTLMGAHVGRRVFLPSPDVVDFHLLHVGDDVTFGGLVTLITTGLALPGSGDGTLEGERGSAQARVTLEAGCSCFDSAILAPGTHVRRRAAVGSYTFLRTHSRVAEDSVWQGWPPMLLLQRSAQVAKAQLQRHASINAAQGHGLQRQPTYETAALTGGGVDAGKGGGARGDVTDGRGRGSARASASTSAHSFIELVADVARGTATGQERAQAPNMHRLRVSDDGVLPGTLGLGGGMHELQAAGMSDHRYIWGQLGNVLLRFFAAPTTLAVMYVVSYAINQRVERAFDDSVVGSVVSLAVYPACYVVGMFAMVVYLVLSKWLVMGRYREGLYPFWSTRFNLWQLQVVFMKIVDMYVLADLRSSYLLTLVYRLMGATIGADVLLDAHPRVEMDLLTMEDGAVLGYRAFQYGHVIDNMCLQFGRTRVAARAIVGARSMVLIGSTLEADAMLLGYSLALKGELFAPNTVWEGLPAVRVSRGSG